MMIIINSSKYSMSNPLVMHREAVILAVEHINASLKNRVIFRYIFITCYIPYVRQKRWYTRVVCKAERESVQPEMKLLVLLSANYVHSALFPRLLLDTSPHPAWERACEEIRNTCCHWIVTRVQHYCWKIILLLCKFSQTFIYLYFIEELSWFILPFHNRRVLWTLIAIGHSRNSLSQLIGMIETTALGAKPSPKFFLPFSKRRSINPNQGVTTRHNPLHRRFLPLLLAVR